MNTTMKWLLKREFWEHKGGFFWAPAVVGAIMTLVFIVSTISMVAMGSKHGMDFNGVRVTDLSKIVDATQQAEFVHGLTQSYLFIASPLFMVMAFVVFFYCLASLFDERKDRSVLFWKSLPVSDSETVLSKVATALLVAPLLTIAFAFATSLAALLVICIGAAFSGLNIFGAVLASPGLYTSPVMLLAIVPVYLVWALPTVGWLMMVSSWARTKVFLWAVGVPVLAGALLAWFNAMFDFNWDIEWFWKNIVARGLIGVMPGNWFGFVDPEGGMHIRGPHDVQFSYLVAQSWKTLASAQAWIGAAIGAGMLYAATRIRRWKDEG
jgi:ABC-2 type transport system permease protein